MSDNNFGCWKSLDLPYRFFCEASGGNLKVLSKSKIFNEKQIEKHWNNIQREYFGIFGVSEEYKTIAEKQKRIMMLRAQFSATMNRKLLNDINRLESEIEAIQSTHGTENNPDVFCAELSEAVGVQYNADMPARVIFGAVKAKNDNKTTINGKGNAR